MADDKIKSPFNSIIKNVKKSANNAFQSDHKEISVLHSQEELLLKEHFKKYDTLISQNSIKIEKLHMQHEELIKTNSILAKEFSSNQKATKYSLIFSGISALVATATLIITLIER